MNQNYIQGIQQVKSIMKQMQTLQNPMQALQQNPQIQQVMQMCQGQNPQQLFMSLCKQKGIDANEFMSMLNS